MAPILGYWKIRGLAQQIRLYLKYLGVDFEEKLYERGPAPDYSPECWTSEKFNLGLDFPNLPYLIDGDLKLTETFAIITYFAEKHGKGGKTPAERAVLAMVNGKITDIRMGFVRICYDKNYEALKKEYFEKLPLQLDVLSSCLEKQKWFSGAEVDYPDFNAYDLLDTLRTAEPKCLDNHPKLVDFIARIEALPAIKAYISSDAYMKWPFNNKIAAWGGDS